jgi:hypothetical protein
MMEEWKKVLAWIERFSSHPLTDEDDIAFLAEYDDGSTSTFVIDRWTLERGDHVASIIARKRQEAAQLKPGKIVLVYRQKPLGWIRTSLGWLNRRANRKISTFRQ